MAFIGLLWGAFVQVPFYETHIRWYILGYRGPRPTFTYRLVGGIPILALSYTNSAVATGMRNVIAKIFHAVSPDSIDALPPPVQLDLWPLAIQNFYTQDAVDSQVFFDGIDTLVLQLETNLDYTYRKEMRLRTFVAHLVSSLIASALTYPLQVCSTAIIASTAELYQTKPSLGVSELLNHGWNVVKKIHEEKGAAGFFEGLGPHLGQVAIKLVGAIVGLYASYRCIKYILDYCKVFTGTVHGQKIQIPGSVGVGAAASLTIAAIVASQATSYPLTVWSVRRRLGLSPFKLGYWPGIWWTSTPTSPSFYK